MPACDGPSCAVTPARRDAERIGDLFMVMTIGACSVWAAVVAFAVYTMRVGESHSPRAANLLILGGGVAAPTVLLGPLIAYGIPLVATVLAIPEAGVTVRVTAKQWWWRVEYLTPSGPI